MKCIELIQKLQELDTELDIYTEDSDGNGVYQPSVVEIEQLDGQDVIVLA
jgi:hypothetical protein